MDETSRAAPAPPPVAAPSPPPPVPPELRDAQLALLELQKARRFAEAADAYPAFLRQLERASGDESEGLASYYYNFGLALKLAGRVRECLRVAATALGRWPDSLQLQVLDATTRVVVAIEEGVFDPRADELYRRFLRPANYPRLRGLRLELADLYAPWAEMLLQARRLPAALELADVAVSLDPRNQKCLAVKARALLSLQRGQEARAILQGLVLDSPRLRLEAGLAEEQCGDLEGAWSHYASVLEDRSAVASLGGQLQLRAATVLNGLGRPGEAAQLLAELLAVRPDDVPALNQLAISNRLRQRLDATRALGERVRSLMHRQNLLEMAGKAKRANARESALYYGALASVEVQRLGEALSGLELAIRANSRLSSLYRERARIRLLLCRYRSAELELRQGIARTSDAELMADLARVQALRGNREEMRRTIAKVEELRARSAGARRDAERETALELKLSRALLESRDYARAGALLDATTDGVVAAAEKDLCLTEIAWREGRFEKGRELLRRSFQDLPGGASWAGALRHLLGDSGDAPPQDPSDLLDHPRLFLGEAPAPPLGADRTGRDVLASLRKLHARRLEILARMEGYSDQDAVSGWVKLLELYREAGARRKAREVAWFLVHLRPTDADAREELARALSTDEEAVVRFAVLNEVARLRPGSAHLRRELADASRFLGLNDDASSD